MLYTVVGILAVIVLFGNKLGGFLKRVPIIGGIGTVNTPVRPAPAYAPATPAQAATRTATNAVTQVGSAAIDAGVNWLTSFLGTGNTVTYGTDGSVSL
jgi:hypothetical protein